MMSNNLNSSNQNTDTIQQKNSLNDENEFLNQADQSEYFDDVVQNWGAAVLISYHNVAHTHII